MIEGIDDLDRLAGRFAAAATVAGAGANAALRRAAVDAKTALAKDAEGIAHAPRFPASISYDIELVGFAAVEAIIGPSKSRPQGALGNILYFGTSNNAPVLDLGVGLREAVPGFEKALGDLADGIV